MSKERNEVLDICKGLAIILVVIGHCYSKDNIVLQTIYSFHMPCFFVISGIIYGMKMRKKEYAFSYEKTALHLLVPYLIFSSLFAVFLEILNPIDMGGKFQDILFLKGISSYWYLPCILFVEIIFFWIREYFSKLQWILAILLLIVGLTIQVNGMWVVLWRVFVGIGFFALGIYGNEKWIKKYSNRIILLFLIIFGISSYVNGMVTMIVLRFHNVFLYLVSSIAGTFLILQLARYIANNIYLCRIKSYVNYYGKNTLQILCTHHFIIEIIRLMDYKLFNNILPSLGVMEGIIFGVIVLIIEVSCINIIGTVEMKLKL